MATTAKKETLGFQAEIQQLLDLMIHSLYGEREIFLRELISNASDAAERLRFDALKDETLYQNDVDLNIRIEYNKDNNTITVLDNGIGMSRQEVIDNLGTIAKSGTKQFLSSLTGDKSKDSKMIGEFGVGFYSAFIVARKIDLTTRKAGLARTEAVRWISEGSGSYSVEMANKAKRGTKIVLYLRDDATEFLNGSRLRTIIKKYSDHISLPILMPTEDTDTVNEQKDSSSDQKDTSLVSADEIVNRATALWTRNKKSIKEEEYHEFYKHISHDFQAPLAYVHNQVEGKLEYTSLLYIPTSAPFDLWDRQKRHGIKLYVRRTYIMDDAEHLMPAYLRFVRGVIDSDDLPLNVSREILQQNKTIDLMRAGSTRKILDILGKLAKNQAEKYTQFWQIFGRVMKEGVIEEHDRKDDLIALLRFSSTDEDKQQQTVSLEDYLSRMSKDQEVIYYVIADSFSTAKNSPHLEIFRGHNIEVLLLSDPIDEWVVSNLPEFKGKKLQSIAKGTVDFGDSDNAKDDKKDTTSNDLTAKMKKVLERRVQDVRVTNRLTQSPACLVADENSMGLNFERILKASGQDIAETKPILELNIEHPLVKQMHTASPQQFEDWSHIFFDQALLSEGGQIADPANFVHRLNTMFMLLDPSIENMSQGNASEKKISKKKISKKKVSKKKVAKKASQDPKSTNK